MPVHDKIVRSDYNNLRNKINPVLGVGSADNGWGQTVQSTEQTVSNRVTVNEWGRLRYDIINAWKHIYGTTPTIVNVPEGQTVRYSNTFTPEDTGLIDAPLTQYDNYLNTIVANKFVIHPSQAATFNWATSSTTWPGVFGSFWTAKLQATVTVTFPTANEARHFFNSGGEIRFASAQSGGSGTQQILSWRSILSTAGTQAFGGNKPGTGTTPNDGQNWYRITNNYQVWYSVFGSSPYGSNNYRISVRTGIEPTTGSRVTNNSTGSATVAEFLVEYIDNYVDPGQHPSNPVPDTIDAVDGTFSLALSHLYATGVLEPTGTGNFSVTQPTITVGQIAP